MSLKKKIGIITLSLLILVIIVFYFMFKYSVEHSLDGNISIEQETLTSSLGDKFLIEFEAKNFPNQETDVTITDFGTKEQVDYFVLHGELQKESLETLINTEHIRCYKIYNSLLYSVDNSKYNSIFIDQISKTSPKEQPLFVGVAKALVDKKEWKWIKICGNFLVKDGDEEMKATLERYSKGQFSQEELDLNKNSEINKAEMQSLAKQVIEVK